MFLQLCYLSYLLQISFFSHFVSDESSHRYESKIFALESFPSGIFSKVICNLNP